MRTPLTGLAVRDPCFCDSGKPFSECHGSVSDSTAYASANFGPHDQDPRVISQPAPEYPYQAKRADIEGAVLVEFIVNVQGQVINPIVVGSTDPVFEKAAIEAVKEWKFAAALHEGQPVSVPVLRLITFTNKEHTPAISTAQLVQAMQIRMPLTGVSTHDPCFCDSGKPFSECHGTGSLVVK
jgi:TonB family protein